MKIWPHMVVRSTLAHHIVLLEVLRTIFTGPRQRFFHRYSQPLTRTAFNQ